MEYTDLYTLQNRVKAGIEEKFPNRIWVRAEISAVKSRAGGHCYLELSQMKDERLVAKTTGIIWRSRYGILSEMFRRITGSEIGEGMEVLAEVYVNFNELYGYSLIIHNIDPAFTLGDKEAQRQKTIARLKAGGMMDLQKRLSIGRLPYRLAVISAENAAGYRDFMKHLHENEYGFVFHTDLFPATLQGANCPSSIAEAIFAASDKKLVQECGESRSDNPTLFNVSECGNEGSCKGRFYDAILILRGGGGKLDLACYDDYDLAVAIAKCPVPVFTAVGHDQDFHVCDMVARAFVKTPTALADAFLDCYAAEDSEILSYGSRLKSAFLSKISQMSSQLDICESRIRSSLVNKAALMSSQLDMLESAIKGADPRNILKRGYVLALDGDGIVMKSATGQKAGDKVSMMFADGVLECTVDDVRRTGNVE